MSDKTDPRLAAIEGAVLVDPDHLLADIDAADRAAGVVRVDTRDDEVMKLIRFASGDPGAFVKRDRTDPDKPESVPTWQARAVLAAMRAAS